MWKLHPWIYTADSYHTCRGFIPRISRCRKYSCDKRERVTGTSGAISSTFAYARCSVCIWPLENVHTARYLRPVRVTSYTSVRAVCHVRPMATIRERYIGMIRQERREETEREGWRRERCKPGFRDGQVFTYCTYTRTRTRQLLITTKAGSKAWLKAASIPWPFGFKALRHYCDNVWSTWCVVASDGSASCRRNYG